MLGLWQAAISYAPGQLLVSYPLLCPWVSSGESLRITILRSLLAPQANNGVGITVHVS